MPVELDVTADNLNETISAERNTSIVVHGHRGTATTSLNPTVKDGKIIIVIRIYRDNNSCGNLTNIIA